MQGLTPLAQQRKPAPRVPTPGEYRPVRASDEDQDRRIANCKIAERMRQCKTRPSPRTRLDGLLRHLAVLPPDPGTGRVAAPACAHVLLETVAVVPHQGVPALGVGKRTAILTAISSKSYWHLSRSMATQTGMTTDWLKAQGLISIRELWMKAQGYA
jgi:hypothetical protein